MIEADEVFNPKDFESIRLIVYFRNFTTGTFVRDPKQASLVEIGNHTLVFELPTKSCNAKHNVMVEIKQADRKDKKTEHLLLAVTGKVLSVEDVDEECLRVTVDCLQYDDQSWDKLINIYAERQEEITKFLAQVKG